MFKSHTISVLINMEPVYLDFRYHEDGSVEMVRDCLNPVFEIPATDPDPLAFWISDEYKFEIYHKMQDIIYGKKPQ